MKIALDPYMFRSTPLRDLPGLVRDLGYDWIELSPRPDFVPFFVHPRADRARIHELKGALAAAGVQLASLLPLYHWSSTDEDERVAAVRYWKRAIEIAVELDCRVMNSEFSGNPEHAAASESQWWRSLEALLPVFEREEIALRLEPHPGDFVEDGFAAIQLIRAVDSPLVSFVFCAPHTFHMGGDIGGIVRDAGALLTHVHLADALDHRASSGLRYIVNPRGSSARVHQHLDIGQGEVDWNVLFGSLAETRFDGTLTSCVFAWEDRAEESSISMRASIARYLEQYPLGRSGGVSHA